MSGFHEVRFPDNIAYGATGGPEFATTVVATSAGHEKRNVNWAQARGRWDVASGLKKQAQIDELIAFFRARRGKAYGFRFKDWTDFKATGQLLGTGDDATTQFRLVKHYPSGSVIEVRAITKPVAGTVKVYLDSVEQLSGWSVDTPAMRAHLDAETTQLAAIWRITRKDGQQFFFTDHDRDIVFGGDTYRADAGFERTAIRSDAGFAVDNLDLVGVFAEGGIVEDEVRAGLFDGAEIALSFVRWQEPNTYGEIKLRKGTLGEVRLTPQGHFTAELRGLSQPLAQSTLQIYGPACRADLGDDRCRFPIKPPVLGREEAVQPGEFYRVATGMGVGFQVYQDRIYEVTAVGTTDAVQPTYDTTIGNPTTDGTAMLTARDSFMRVAVVETATSNRVFTTADVLAAYEDHWFASGALTFETGANAGRTLEIKGWTQLSRTLELWEPARRAVQIGDQFRLYAGCSKRVLEDCRDKFQIPGSLLFTQGNARNFRGEPYVPGGALVAQAR